MGAYRIMWCTQCGQVAGAGSRYCARCGSPVFPPDESSAPPVQPTNTSSERPRLTVGSRSNVNQQPQAPSIPSAVVPVPQMQGSGYVGSGGHQPMATKMNRTVVWARVLLGFLAIAGLTSVGYYFMMSSTESGQSAEITTPNSPDAPSSGAENGLDAGTRYLAIVNPVNCAVRRVADLERRHSLGNGTVDPSFFEDFISAWAERASARQSAYRELLAARWPTAVAADIEVLAREWANLAQMEQDVANSYDVGSYNLALQQILSAPSEANPGAIRAMLGLAPAEETDRC